MHIHGDQLLAGSPEEVWDILMDPATIARTIPGCDDLEQVAEDTFVGHVHINAGFISSAYTVEFRVLEPRFPAGYRLHIYGEGGAGTVEGDVRILLEPVEPGQTHMRYDGAVALGGLMGGLGQRFVQPMVQRLIGKGFEDLALEIEQRLRR